MGTCDTCSEYKTLGPDKVSCVTPDCKGDEIIEANGNCYRCPDLLLPSKNKRNCIACP